MCAAEIERTEPAGARPATRTLRLSARWIVSPRYDLVFFIGSCVLTWAFLGLYHALGRVGAAPSTGSILITYFVFTAFFDHPHIFQTFSRTHLDRVEFARHRRSHTWGLAAFIVAGLAIVAAGLQEYLIVFGALYGSWHIVRQHWGILSAYKYVNGDRAEVDRWLDFATFYVGAAAFYFYDYTGNPPETIIYGELQAPFPNLPDAFGEVAWYGFLALLLTFLGRQIWLLRAGRPVNVPKLLIMTAALSTHGLVFFFTATPFLVAEALETAYHDVQYQGWMMHYQRHRFTVRSTVKRWVMMALVYGAVVGTLEVVGLVYPRWSWFFIPFAMVVLWHYWVDGKIWKMGRQQELREAVLRRATTGRKAGGLPKAAQA